MKSWINGIFVIAAGIFLIGGYSESMAVEAGQKAPEFTLSDMCGKAVSLSYFKGKAIILDFFATWCPPCRQEIPDFVDLQKTYGPKGFTMIGVSLVTLQETKEFAAKIGISYPVLIDDGKVSASYGPVRAIPTTFVIDKNSTIVKMYIGYRPKEQFEKDIKAILK